MINLLQKIQQLCKQYPAMTWAAPLSIFIVIFVVILNTGKTNPAEQTIQEPAVINASLVQYEQDTPQEWLQLLSDEDKITLKVEAVALDELMIHLAQQSHINLVIPKPIKQPITLSFSSASSQEVFSVLAKVGKLKIYQHHNTLIVLPKNAAFENIPLTSHPANYQDNQQNNFNVPAKVNLPAKGYQ